MLLDECGQLLFCYDGDTCGVLFSCELGRIFTSVDVRNLISCECYYVVVFVSAEIGVEIVEISTCGTNDNYFSFKIFIINTILLIESFFRL